MGVDSDATALAFSGSVCLICFPYAPSLTTRRGIDRYAYETVTGLRQSGFAAEVIQGGQRTPNPLERFRQAVSFALHSIRSKGSVYHALDPLGAVPFLLTRKRPLAVTVHDTLWFASPHIYDPNPHRFRFYSMRIITRACLARADAIFVPFEDTRDRLQKLDPSCASRIRVVPYGLTPRARQPQSNQPAPSRGDVDSQPSILFIGGDQPVVRGGSLCVRIFNALLLRRIPARLTFVGSGPQMETIRKQAQSLGVEGRIDFLSIVPEGDLIDFIGSFDVFVYPSILGFSFLLLQSMEAGTPVVANDERDLKEFIADAGVVCSRDDVDGFVNAIEKLLVDPQSRASMSIRATQRAARFTTQQMATSLIAEYRELQGTQRPN
jgi:glycosyltransferase involved in cell wall biosynthesis